MFTKITSTNTTNDYYCFNCFHSFRTENKLKEHESICENHDYCRVLMPEKKQRIIEYKPGTYSLKKEFVIDLDIECKLAKHKTCSNNPDKSYSKNINTHIPTGYSLNVVSQNGKSKHFYHRGIDCMTELVQHLLRTGNKLIRKEKVSITPLTTEQNRQHSESNKCFIFQKKFNNNPRSKFYKKF